MSLNGNKLEQAYTIFKDIHSVFDTITE